MTTSLRRARFFVATLAVIAVSASLIGLPSAGATLPGGNGPIFFVRSVNGQERLFVVDPDGSNLHEFNPDLGQVAFPSIFAAGAKLALLSNEAVQVIATDGSEQHALPPTAYPGLYMTAAPDGTAFAYLTGDGTGSGDGKVGVDNFDGTDRHILLPDSGMGEWYPQWSPDSQKLAFIRTEGVAELWVMNRDGSSPHLVTASDVGYHAGAGWSPDGSQLIFSSDIYDWTTSTWIPHVSLVDLDGSNRHELPMTLPVGRSFAPAFSPDGTKIVFSLSGDAPGLYTADVDGSNLQRITTDSDYGAIWQPITAATPPTTSTSTTTTSTTTTTIPNAAPQPIITIGRVKDTLTLKVNAARSSDSDGTIAAYKWQWGDNTAAATTAAASHTYAKAGDYVVRLTVTDEDGARSTATLWVRAATRTHSVNNSVIPTPTTVPKSGTNKVPIPVIGLAFANYPMQLQTTGNHSTDSDGRVVAYAWDFGDGYTTGSNPAAHIYTWPGTRKLTLTVTDDDGATASTEVWVRVD